jgi:hypothetical protein
VTSNAGERAKDVMQVLAILYTGAFFAMILHKGCADIFDLAQRYAGGEFWVRLARYAIANLAGG